MSLTTTLSDTGLCSSDEWKVTAVWLYFAPHGVKPLTHFKSQLFPSLEPCVHILSHSIPPVADAQEEMCWPRVHHAHMHTLGRLAPGLGAELQPFLQFLSLVF